MILPFKPGPPRTPPESLQPLVRTQTLPTCALTRIPPQANCPPTTINIRIYNHCY
ncbi:hypothetical protein BDZ91DRAFT_720443 [Kalaharituber pfeilii]|nr:hypothetical protein BDZ91DRAFT_720443 [Kalaharituber pfeilii]